MNLLSLNVLVRMRIVVETYNQLHFDKYLTKSSIKCRLIDDHDCVCWLFLGKWKSCFLCGALVISSDGGRLLWLPIGGVIMAYTVIMLLCINRRLLRSEIVDDFYLKAYELTLKSEACNVWMQVHRYCTNGPINQLLWRRYHNAWSISWLRTRPKPS